MWASGPTLAVPVYYITLVPLLSYAVFESTRSVTALTLYARQI